MKIEKLYQDKEKKAECSKRYYQKNKERLLAKSRKYYQEHKEEFAAWHKKYYQENQERYKEHYQKNKIEILAKHKKWRKNNPEYGKEQSRKWRAKNPEHSKEYQIKWQKENRKHINEMCKQRRKDNPKYEKKYSRRWRKTKKGKASGQRRHTTRRVREREIINTLTSGEWLDILKEYDYKCAYCGCGFDENILPERDHIIPISKGGHNTKDNVVPACRSCNAKKGNKILIQEMMQWSLE